MAFIKKYTSKPHFVPGRAVMADRITAILKLCFSAIIWVIISTEVVSKQCLKQCAEGQNKELQGGVEGILIPTPWKPQMSPVTKTEQQVPHLTEVSSAAAKKKIQFLEGLIIS